MKITVRTSADVVRMSACTRVYPVDAVLPADGFLPSADARAWTRVDPRLCGHGADARTCVDTRQVATSLRRRGAASA
jgi:hypothetical protein